MNIEEIREKFPPKNLLKSPWEKPKDYFQIGMFWLLMLFPLACLGVALAFQ